MMNPFSKKGLGRGYIYNLVDKYNEKSPYPSLLIYPEGTRHQKRDYLKLYGLQFVLIIFSLIQTPL